MTSQPSEQSEATSEPSVSPPPGSSMPRLLPSSGKQPGTPYQNRVTDAVTGSEFTDSVESGIPIRRKGSPLKISYDQAMEYLWPSTET
jgi:hypothetical protein